MKNLTEYSATHRTREKGFENGYVVETGKKVKKWLGYYHVYEDGKRKKRERIIGECSKMTKTQAKEEHRKWIRRLHENPVAVTGKATVADLCDDYLVMRQGEWEKSSLVTNRGLFNRVVKPVLGSKPVASVTAEDLKKFINDLPNRKYKTGAKTKKGISESYCNKVITMIRAVFDLAQERDLITKNPARSINVRLRRPKQVKKPDKSVFPPQYIVRLLGSVEGQDRLILMISWFCGTRPGELFAIRPCDVMPNRITISRTLDRWCNIKESTKTDKSREAYVPPDTAVELNDWIRRNNIGREDLIFTNTKGGPVSRNNYLKRTLRKLVKEAGIPVPDVDFQMLRRSFATFGKACGIDLKSIQEQMGHSRPDMTATEYIQSLDPVRMKQIREFELMVLGKLPMPVDLMEKLATEAVQ